MEALLSYFQNVLGIRSVIRPSENPTSVLIFVEPGTYHAPEEELLKKMISAIQIPWGECRVFQISAAEIAGKQTEIEAASLILNLYPQLVEIIRSKNSNLPIISTHSPASLLKNPALKREAWEALKKAQEIRHKMR